MAVTNVGFVIDDPITPLEHVQTVFTTTFGTGVNLFPSSINGILIQQLTNQVIQSNNAQVLLYSSVYNPNVTGYPWLDSICSFDSITRGSATGSTVTCNVIGLSGVVIPIGSLITDANGNSFSNTQEITIPSGGTISVEFTQSTNPNLSITPISSSTDYTINQQISGWDGVVYTSSLLGTTQQSDYSLRNTRREQLGLNSTGSTLSVISALYQLTLETNPIIQDFYVYNNNRSSPTNPADPTQVLGITVAPYTLYISLYPEITDTTNQQTIAGIIANKISSGCQMQGDTTINYTPYPSTMSWVVIPITWDTPDMQEIDVTINISSSYLALLTDNVKDTIYSSVSQTFNQGTDTIPPVQMGVIFYASQFADILLQLGFVYYTITVTNHTASGSPVASLLLPVTQVAVLRNIFVTATLS